MELPEHIAKALPDAVDGIQSGIPTKLRLRDISRCIKPNLSSVARRDLTTLANAVDDFSSEELDRVILYAWAHSTVNFAGLRVIASSRIMEHEAAENTHLITLPCDLVEAVKNDTEWKSKKPGFVLRTRFDPSRVDVVKAARNAGIDAAFSSGPDSESPNRLSDADMLGSRHVIAMSPRCMRWALEANVTPLMPRPKTESYLHESKLQPYLHYVPVKADGSNLREQMAWCRENEVQCEAIAARGRELAESGALDSDDAKTIRDYLEAFRVSAPARVEADWASGLQGLSL